MRDDLTTAARRRRSTLTTLAATCLAAAAACGTFGSDGPDAPADVDASAGAPDADATAPVDGESSRDAGLAEGGVPDGMLVANPGAAAPLRFAIDRTEVTVAAFGAYVASGAPVPSALPGCGWKNAHGPAQDCTVPSRAGSPMVCVDACDAAGFCAAAGKRLCGKPGGGPASFVGADRAQESQWTWACAGGLATARYPYGETYVEGACNVGRADGGVPRPVPAADACRTPDGAFDLSGNVWEWEDACQPSGGANLVSCRVRGGAATSPPGEGRCDFLGDLRVDDAREDVGFRCCLDL